MVRVCCSPEAMRIVLWMAWVTNMLITTIYYLLSFTTFYKLLQASSEVLRPGTIAAGGSQNTLVIDAGALVLDPLWRAPLAATLLGGLLVLGFNLFSCIILLKKSINRSGPGFGYGFLVAFCFTLSFFLLLVVLIMDSFRSNIQKFLETSTIHSWSKYSTELYVGAEVLAIMTFVMLMIFFLCLVIFQSAVTDQLGISRDMANPYAPMGADAGAIAMTSAPGPGGIAGAKGETLMGGGGGPSQYGGYAPPDAGETNNYYGGAGGASPSYQAAPDYQATTEYQTTEYTYEQEQQGGYQDQQYQADGGYGQPTYDNNGAPPPQYGAAAYQPPATNFGSDFNPAAAFHAQQGAFATPATQHQQL